MTIEKTWRYMGSLIFAGLASLFSSLLGCLLILGVLWQQYSAKELVPFLLLALEVPLFALAVGVSKRFIICLWATTFIYPFAVILLTRDMFDKGSRSFLMLVVGAGTVALALVAALLRYSTRFDVISHGADSQGTKNAPEA
jgi:hypothetical protein